MNPFIKIALEHNDRCITWMHNDTLVADNIPYMFMMVLDVFREYDTKDDMFEVNTTAISVETSKLLAEWILSTGDNERNQKNFSYEYNILMLLDAANYYCLDKKLFDKLTTVNEYKAWKVVNDLCAKYPEDYLDAWYVKIYDNAVNYIYVKISCWDLNMCDHTTMESPRGQKLMIALVKSDKPVNYDGTTCGRFVMDSLLKKDKGDLSKEFLVTVAKSYEKAYPDVSLTTYHLFKKNEIDEEIVESHIVSVGSGCIKFYNSCNNVQFLYQNNSLVLSLLVHDRKYMKCKVKFSLYTVHTVDDKFVNDSKIDTCEHILCPHDVFVINLNEYEAWKTSTDTRYLRLVVEECEDVAVDH